MNLNPLKKYDAPEYPAGMDKKTGFLNSFIPQRWLRPAVMAGAAIMLFAASPGIPAFDTGSVSGICFAAKNNNSGQSVWNFGKSLIAANDNTPHPEFGRTAGKPVMISTLTEAEAKKIVDEELAKVKVSFEKKNFNIGTKEAPLVLDGYSPSQKKGYKVISRSVRCEIITWSGDKSKSFNTCQEMAVFVETQLLLKGIQCVCIYIPDYVSKEEAKASVGKQADALAKKMKAEKTE